MRCQGVYALHGNSSSLSLLFSSNKLLCKEFRFISGELTSANLTEVRLCMAALPLFLLTYACLCCVGANSRTVSFQTSPLLG